MHLDYTVKSSNGQVVADISGFHDGISVEGIDTEILREDTLSLQVTDRVGGKLLADLRIPLGAAIDADTCSIKYKRKLGKLLFTAALKEESAQDCSGTPGTASSVGDSVQETRSSAPVSQDQRDASVQGSLPPSQTPLPQGDEDGVSLGIAPPIDCRYLSVAMSQDLSSIHRQMAQSDKARAKEQERVNGILHSISDTLNKFGYAVCDNFIPEALVSAARAELNVMTPHYTPGLIWVGKESQAGAQISVSDVRGDIVLWLDKQALAATAFIKDGQKRGCSFHKLGQMLDQVDSLVLSWLRPRAAELSHLHMRSDAMFAIYPGQGARFAKHVDNTTGDGRRLTVLTYLNPSWQPEQGGALRLFPVAQGAASPVDVLPLAGRLAMFYSHQVAHEVMPAFAMRHSVTLWFYDAREHAEALASDKASSVAGSSPAAQAQARELLRDMLADTLPADEEGCAALSLRVAALSNGAVDVVAAVTGAPSPQAFREQMRVLTPDRLLALRHELRSMGLAQQHHAPDTTAHAA